MKSCPVHRVGNRYYFAEIRKRQPRARLRRLRLQHAPDAAGEIVGRGAAALEYAGLLGGYELGRIAEHGGVVEADVHYDGALRPGNHVRGVEAAAEAGLEHDDIAAPLREVIERERRAELELGAGVGHAPPPPRRAPCSTRRSPRPLCPRRPRSCARLCARGGARCRAPCGIPRR